MDPRSKVLQKPIYQAISKVWGAGSSFINTVLVISQRCLYLIQSNDSRDFEHPVFTSIGVVLIGYLLDHQHRHGKECGLICKILLH